MEQLRVRNYVRDDGEEALEEFLVGGGEGAMKLIDQLQDANDGAGGVLNRLEKTKNIDVCGRRGGKRGKSMLHTAFEGKTSGARFKLFGANEYTYKAKNCLRVVPALLVILLTEPVVLVSIENVDRLSRRRNDARNSLTHRYPNLHPSAQAPKVPPLIIHKVKSAPVCLY